MRSQPVLIAALAALFSVTSAHTTNSSTGAIQAIFNATSLERVLDDFSIIMPDFILRESDFSYDIDISNGYVYDLKINGIKLRQLDINNKTVKILPGTSYPTMFAEVSNVNAQVGVTGGLQVGPYQMFNFTELTLVGLKFNIGLGIVRDKNNSAHWQITAASMVDFDDLYINTDSIVLNTALQVVHAILVMFLKSYENGYGSYFNQLINEYNILLRTHSTFLVPWPDKKHHRMNMTVTQVPNFDADSQLATAAIEGSIFDTYLKTTHVDSTMTQALPNPGFQGNQFFIHQTALASFFYSVYDQIMPYKIDDIASSLEIIAEFPEIKKHYGGHGTAVNMSITMTPSSGKFLSVSTDNGIAFGKDDDLYITMELYCSNNLTNMPTELCVTFDIKAAFWLNVTVQDFDLYLMINDAVLDSVTITKDVVGMKDREYQRVLQHILNYAIANFNFVFSTPISLNSTHILVPVAREFIQMKISPYVQNEFLWIGFDAKTNVHTYGPDPAPINVTNETVTVSSHKTFVNKFEENFLW